MDGMNRYRAGLHVPGNVVIACKACNSEKRRDDSLKTLVLAPTGWESFLSHDGVRCVKDCRTCRYWLAHWGDNEMQQTKLSENLHHIRDFRSRFSEFQAIIPTLQLVLPELLTKLYSDCQSFAETEIKLLLERFNQERLLNPVSSNRP